MRNKHSRVLINGALALIIGLGSFGCSDDEQEVEEVPQKVVREYYDRDNDGLYESYRTIKIFGRTDTSEVHSLYFSTQFDGWGKYRKESKEALENLFRDHGYPANVNEIGFCGN